MASAFEPEGASFLTSFIVLTSQEFQHFEGLKSIQNTGYYISS
jgi:hypothetical protein